MYAISAGQPMWIQEVLNSYAVDPQAQELLKQLAITGASTEGFSLQHGLIKLHDKVWIWANTRLQTKIIQDFHASAMGVIRECKQLTKESRKSFPGLDSKLQSRILLGNVAYVNKLNMNIASHLVYCSHLKFQQELGRTFPWISLKDCLNQLVMR